MLVQEKEKIHQMGTRCTERELRTVCPMQGSSSACDGTEKVFGKTTHILSTNFPEMNIRFEVAWETHLDRGIARANVSCWFTDALAVYHVSR